MEYFSVDELMKQINFPRDKWPLAITKELIDNALDACESAKIPIVPIITVSLDGASVTVADNGPGLPEKTLEGSLDYTQTVTDKAYTTYHRPAGGWAML